VHHDGAAYGSARHHQGAPAVQGRAVGDQDGGHGCVSRTQAHAAPAIIGFHPTELLGFNDIKGTHYGALLGHAKLDTTALYTRVANTPIRAVISPLDGLASLSEEEPKPAA
jgi:hypothetical protein